MYSKLRSNIVAAKDYVLRSARSTAAVAVTVGTAVVSGTASATATPIDVSATTDAIAAAVGPIGEIGLATLAVFVAIKTYKWVRRAM